MKKEKITISVRIVKDVVALARDRLVDIGLKDKTNTLSDIVRNTFYGGLVLMNQTNSKQNKTEPSKEALAFIDNLRHKKATGITNVWIDKLTGDNNVKQDN